MARTYPVHMAKAKLSEILRQVKQGRSVTISERGTEIARVIPVETPHDLLTRLEQLRSDGVILPPREGLGTIRPVARRRGALRRFIESRG